MALPTEKHSSFIKTVGQQDSKISNLFDVDNFAINHIDSLTESPG